MIEALLQAERLLIHGMVDQAEQIYAGAIEQDPRNAIAMVGLARVALERGDDRLALERARAALELDPDNPAAQRLEVRMSEVIGAAALPGVAPERQRSVPATEDVRPSERAVFTRNPSMADHQRMEHQRAADEPHASPRKARPSAMQPPPPPAKERRPGLLRRLLGE